MDKTKLVAVRYTLPTTNVGCATCCPQKGGQNSISRGQELPTLHGCHLGGGSAYATKLAVGVWI
ncbi:MAG: hypothetical protein CTY38_11775 [Methylotenera sp.]|uniref:hypothetical protein n=1 Tax=Methylotenera sp. TaxID=2051956 RepID=UPI000D4B2139|nr:hypothetical protein [Methylotenera sp.]PPC80107.1 MAG: hypothetical protein CTY38_11775 [Methylotenera sp.]